jgi:hypothetical protein
MSAASKPPRADKDAALQRRLVSLERRYPSGLLVGGREVVGSKGVPDRTFKAGEVADPVPIEEGNLERLVRAALIRKKGAERILWRNRGGEVLVHLDRTRLRVMDGFLLVALTLETAETGPQELTVPFALGTEKRLSGMLAVSERRPRGHLALVETWGEGVIATAWRAVLEVADVVSALLGSDERGRPLRAGALVAQPGVLAVVPQAMHLYERAAGVDRT